MSLEDKRTVLEGIKSSEDSVNWKQFVRASNVDSNTGIGERLSIVKLKQLGIVVTGNGNTLRSSCPIHQTFKLNSTRESKTSNKIIELQIVGYQDDEFNSPYQSVPKAVRNQVHKLCANCDVHHEIFEIDHKIGIKEKYADEAIRNDPNQYQTLCKNVNDAKRQHCKDCRRDSKRFDARLLGFHIPVVSGSIYLDDSKNPCTGCYWYDLKVFRKEHGVIALKLNIAAMEAFVQQIDSGASVEDVLNVIK